DLAVFAERRAKARTIEIGGERFDLAALPFAAEEGRIVARFGDAPTRGRTEVPSGGELAGYRVLHFATHGLLSRGTPERSALVLASRKGDGDARLEAQEIRSLRLSSDLVVLSACQTARGKILPGEGVQGLSQAFFQAGARTVVGSLWNVNDRRASELIAAFYRHLAAGERQAEALRSAKLDLLRESPGLAPQVWAPFVLIGDPFGTVPLKPAPWWRRVLAPPG